MKLPNNPFFPDPLGEFEPKKPDFEPEIDPDYENHLEDNCDFCGRQFGVHTKLDLTKCALSILRGENPTVQ
jgi:hypothetical protein